MSRPDNHRIKRNVQTAEKIAQRLNVSIKHASEGIEFMLAAGLLELTTKGELRVGKSQIHLGADSPLISKHHINWRLQAIRSIDHDPNGGLHDSSVISISKKDEKVISEKLIETIKELKQVIRESKEEDIAVFSLDLFTP